MGELSDLNKLQTEIMVFVKWWANTNKTTIPQKDIIVAMREKGIKTYTTANAIKALITKGYIRKAYSEQQNRTFYVQIRNIKTPDENSI